MLNIHKNTSLACIKLHTANPTYIMLNIHKKHIISNMQYIMLNIHKKHTQETHHFKYAKI